MAPDVAEPVEDGLGRARGRRSGRRPGANETRRDILRAARRLFAEYGYGGATMRTIAREADVDAALIHHFFVSKEGVFAAAIEDSFQRAPIADDAPAGGPGPGERVVRGFLELWSNPDTRDPMLAVVRSAPTYDEAARLLRDLVGRRVAEYVAETVDHDEAGLRATLVGSQLLGLALLRDVVKVEPLASADPETIVRFLAPTVDRYLAGELDPL
jgi:AcrR family transcriptional regulator